MIRTTRILATAVIAVVAVLGSSGVAGAQAGADVRNIRPHFVLLADSSGSMERMGSCVCTTATCTECLPVCSAPRFDRNRWATILEALTGSWSSFSCAGVNRTAYVGAYDYRYYIPHHTHPTALTQGNDGILDVYVDRVRFGLMTFDGIGTLRGQPALVAATSWTGPFVAQSNGIDGMYSYGGPKPFGLPGCVVPYMMDNGARGPWTGAGPPPPDALGNLVSVGTDATDHRFINANIQSALLGTRPYGATPIAGQLDDLRYYYGNHPDVAPSATGDPYAQCRGRYALVLTDGYPNADMREPPYNCGAPGASCPYQRPEEIAADLCRYDPGSSACRGTLDGIFVVGFNIADAAAVAKLNGIAAAGGTGSAYFADDRPSLMAALAAALDRAAPGTTTRTVPAFANTGSGSSSQAQHQFTTGFRIPLADGSPWQGVLERHRFECSGTTVVPRAISDGSNDLFHNVLNRRVLPRNLYTVVTRNAALTDQWLTGTGASEIPAGLVPSTFGPDVPAATGLAVEPFTRTNLNITPRHVGVATAADRDRVIDWVHATPASSRAGWRLGDIYHSSPVVVTAPRTDIADESFNLFREQPRVSERPPVLYVGTNDGILHAFVTENHTIASGPYAGTYAAGDELWGFIPPMLMPKLDDAMASHQWMVDATPVVRDVFYARMPAETPSATQYRTVLIVGLRGGGAGYIALDVTEPVGPPKFLWQFTHRLLGATYGAAGVAQVLTTIRGALHERSIAILPGGMGSIDPVRTVGPIGCPAGGIGEPPANRGTKVARSRQRCWNREGRQMYVLDVSTGLLLRHISDRTFTAPLSGGVSVFTGDTGTIGTRAFFTDHDGFIWRLDLSAVGGPNSWDVSRFYDIFYDSTASGGQPGYNPPIVSSTVDGKLVIIQSTGDIDLLDSTLPNRVVSLTEDVTFDATGAVTDVEHIQNWEIMLGAGEQVTGPLELFDGKVYFGTFTSTSSPSDMCQFGYSRLWGVDYLLADATGQPRPGLESTPGSGVLDVRYVGPYDNQIIMGVAVAQRPNCVTGVTDTADPYFGSSHFRVTGQGGGSFQLVAQVGGTGAAAPGGSVGEITRDLPRPLAYTRALSFSGTTE